jgi:maltose O-acetyltransferase
MFLLPVVNIHDNSILGANSVVTKDFSANATVGGVPAKLIRYKNINSNE